MKRREDEEEEKKDKKFILKFLGIKLTFNMVDAHKLE